MKNFVLTGFMGTGKTTVGKLIAKKLNRPFFDTDEMIEKQLETSISEIFKKVGEKTFREYEIQVVSVLSNVEDSVISCGGGLVLNKNNITSLRKNGIIINLYASAQHILNRIGEDDNRPIIKKMLHPFDEIKKLLIQRKVAYDNCDLTINTEGLTPEQVAEKIFSNSAVKEILKFEKKNEI
ncbi:MAG: shikimate kinase [Endomicrobiia bacterium]|nr:shikimate kinase [Endomicrobiaceae bacterium]